jgi:hypothetical protein
MALKMETARFSETLASTNQSTRRFKPKERGQHCQRHENLKSHTFGSLLPTFSGINLLGAAKL